MKIGIDLLSYKEMTGWVVYAKNILNNLVRLNQKDEFFLFRSKNLPLNLRFDGVKNINSVIVQWPKTKYTRAFYQQANIYYLLKKYKIDLLFSPSPATPFFYKNKVVTIHDCAYDRFPEFDNFLSKLYFRAMYCGAKYFSKKIITVSNFSKDELINLYGLNPDKIEVIYNGVPELPTINDDTVIKVLKKFKIEFPYFIYIGNNRPRKNTIGLIKAFRIFLENTKQNFSLVIGGRMDKRFIDLESEIKNNGLKNNVILTGFVDAEEKTALCKKANALCFPSFYEGFGLPVLEAQSLGLPVITSNTSSLPEVAGNGALYVDPYDINDMAKAMEEITKNVDLRQELIKKGLENIKRFSWGESTKKILKIFHEGSSNK